MNSNKKNTEHSITIEEFLLVKNVEMVNRRLMDSFISSLIHIGIVILLLPFAIRLALESSRREIITGLVIFAILKITYLFKDNIFKLLQTFKNR